MDGAEGKARLARDADAAGDAILDVVARLRLAGQPLPDDAEFDELCRVGAAFKGVALRVAMSVPGPAAGELLTELTGRTATEMHVIEVAP